MQKHHSVRCGVSACILIFSSPHLREANAVLFACGSKEHSIFTMRALKQPALTSDP
jgi:hypothetical protein